MRHPKGMKGLYLLYPHVSNLDKVDTVLNVTQENIDGLNGVLSVKEPQSIVNNLPKQRLSGSVEFTGEFYQLKLRATRIHFLLQ